MLYVCVTDPATSRGRKKVAKEAEVFNQRVYLRQVLQERKHTF